MDSLVDDARGNDFSKIKLLLENPETNKIDINEGLFTILRSACTHGQIEIVKLLLARPDIDINKHYIRSPLFAACDFGYIEIIKLLLARPEIIITEYVLKLKNHGVQDLIRDHYYNLVDTILPADLPGNDHISEMIMSYIM